MFKVGFVYNHILRSIKRRFEEWTSEWLPLSKPVHKVYSDIESAIVGEEQESTTGKSL